MLKVGDRVKVKYGKFEGCVGTIRSIDYDCLPPVVIMPDDIKKYQGVYFYEDELEKIEEKEMIKMTVDEILSAELTDEELDKVVYVLNKRKEEIFNNRVKKAFINFEKAFTELMKVAPCESININFVNDGVIETTVDILDVLENYFYNASTEYYID